MLVIKSGLTHEGYQVLIGPGVDGRWTIAGEMAS